MTRKYKYCASFRFLGRLGDFLPRHWRQRPRPYRFDGHPGIKDPIEALGVPHSEVAAILVNGRPVDFRYRLQPLDRVRVHPVGGRLPDLPLPALRPALPRPPRFVVDVNLGKLARWLRLLGFDTAWRNCWSDRQVVALAVEEKRVILTRDRRLLFHRVIEHGFWVRAVEPVAQVHEIVERMAIADQVRPFRRCLECNGLIEPVSKAEILDRLEPLTRRYYDEFYRCGGCGRIYWKGSHFERLMQKLEVLRA